MKKFRTILLVAFSLGLVLLSCKPDQVDPNHHGRKDSGIAGAVSEEHPNLDTICKFADSVFFRRNDGSWNVNICNDGEFFSPQIVPCVGPQPRWGHFVMYNGYEYRYDSLTGQTDSLHMLDVDFALAPGQFVDATNWIFTINNTILIDQNTGLPQQGTDWSNLLVDPMRNEWKIRVPVPELPTPCFDMACKMHTVQLSLFEGVIAGSDADIWAINTHWDQTGHPAASNNEFAIHYCPFACLENTTPQCPTPETATECEVVYKGVTCPGNTLGTTTLTPSVTGAATPTFAWSTGATTPSITVSPAATTAYTVTVSSGNCVIRTVTFNVNVIDASCVIAPPAPAEPEFCTYNLDVRYGQTFNIRNYVHMKNGSPINWNNVRFTYTAAGANNQTNPANWKLTQFNAGQNVTVSSSDFGSTKGNKGPGEYRIYVYRVGQTKYDDHMTIRVSNSRPSTVTSSQCSNNNNGGNCGNGGSGSGNGGSGNGGSGSGNGGSGSGNGGSGSGNGGNGTPGVKVCHVPPGNPSGAATVCVSLANLSQHLTNVCGGGSGNGGNGGSGSGSGNGGSGSGNSGSGNSGSGNGGSGSGGHCSHNGGHSGCGSGNGSSHAGDYLGACNSNPCN